MDYETSTGKLGYDSTKLFASSVKPTGKTPDVVTTDAIPGYGLGVAAMTCCGRHKIIHRKDAGIRKRHNNKYERFNGTMKERVKPARGFNTAPPPTPPPLHMLYLAYYNLLRPHSGIGEKTPAEMLGVVLEGPDKWLAAIRHAALFCS